MMRGLALILVAATAHAGPGRVVRVERPRNSGAGSSTVCGEMREDTGVCIGPKPHPGDHVLLADDHQILADLEIRTVAPLSSLLNPSSRKPVPEPCAGLLWSVTTEARVAPTGRLPRLVGLVGDYDPHRLRSLPEPESLPSPTGNKRDTVYGAIDIDGDGTADVLMGAMRCPGDGEHCLAIWDRQGAAYVATTVVPLDACFH